MVLLLALDQLLALQAISPPLVRDLGAQSRIQK